MKFYISSSVSVEKKVEYLQRKLEEICEYAMPRARVNYKNKTYWWCHEIEELRRKSLMARRKVQRARRRRYGTLQEERNLNQRYLDIATELRTEIRKAKTQAWEQLIQTVEQDPWGKPYKMVFGRIKPKTLPSTITLAPEVLNNILNALFPMDNRLDRRAHLPNEVEDGIPPEITNDEHSKAVKRMTSRTKHLGQMEF